MLLRRSWATGTPVGDAPHECNIGKRIQGQRIGRLVGKDKKSPKELLLSQWRLNSVAVRKYKEDQTPKKHDRNVTPWHLWSWIHSETSAPWNYVLQ